MKGWLYFAFCYSQDRSGADLNQQKLSFLEALSRSNHRMNSFSMKTDSFGLYPVFVLVCFLQARPSLCSIKNFHLDEFR